MFVEITRLFIVFLATAAGHTIGGGQSEQPGQWAVIGATLGACIGYVVGGVIGRLLRQAMGIVEERTETANAARMLASAFGAAALGALVALVMIPVAVLVPGRWGWPIFGLFVWFAVSLGWRIAGRKAEEILAVAGLSTRPLIRATPVPASADAAAVLVDTSAILDGRMLAVVRAGFLRHALLVPRFVLDEVQTIADAQDTTKRRRGRRGLDMLDAMQSQPGVELHVLDDEVVEHDEVDAKLVALARRLKVGLVTVDEPLQRIAELQGVRCLNLARLADGLKPVHLPGETIVLPITREGKEPGQGVGFLDDGTMVVVTDAAPLIGSEAEIRVTGSAQTAVGRMLFAALADASAG